MHALAAAGATDHPLARRWLEVEAPDPLILVERQRDVARDVLNELRILVRLFRHVPCTGTGTAPLHHEICLSTVADP